MTETEQEQIARLQTVVTEQELVLEQYGELFRDQQRQLDRLLQRIELMEQKLLKYQEPGDYSEEPEIPPHY